MLADVRLFGSQQGSMGAEACLAPLHYFPLSKALALLLPHEQGSMRADARRAFTWLSLLWFS